VVKILDPVTGVILKFPGLRFRKTSASPLKTRPVLKPQIFTVLVRRALTILFFVANTHFYYSSEMNDNDGTFSLAA